MMEGQFVESLRNILSETGFPDYDKIDLSFYDNISFQQFLSIDLDENLVTPKDIDIVNDLKKKGEFLQEDEVNEALSKYFVSNPDPVILEMDIENLQIELNDLNERYNVKEKLEPYLVDDLENVEAKLIETKDKNTKSENALTAVVSQCLDIDAKLNSKIETWRKEYFANKNAFKSSLSKKELTNDYLFQSGQMKKESYRRTKVILKKVMNRIGQSQAITNSNSSFDSLDSTVLNSTRRVLYEVLVQKFVSNVNVSEQFEKNKKKMTVLLNSLNALCFEKVMSSINECGYLAELDVLKKMSSDLDSGILNKQTIILDVEDVYTMDDLDVSNLDIPVEQIRTACEQWTEVQSLSLIIKKLEDRYTRRKVRCDQLEKLYTFVLLPVIIEDLNWLYIFCEKTKILAQVEAFNSLSSNLSAWFNAMNQRVKYMESLLAENKEVQPTSQKSIDCIQKMLFPNETSMDMNKVMDVIIRSKESVDAMDSVLNNFVSTFNNSMSEWNKNNKAFEKILFDGPTKVSSAVDKSYKPHLNKIQDEITKTSESIETELKFLHQRKEHFLCYPFVKDLFFLWAIFLMDENKVKEIVSNLEREAKLLK